MSSDRCQCEIILNLISIHFNKFSSPVLGRSGTGSNSKVEGHKLPARSIGQKIFDVPLHFSVVPLH